MRYKQNWLICEEKILPVEQNSSVSLFYCPEYHIQLHRHLARKKFYGKEGEEESMCMLISCRDIYRCSNVKKSEYGKNDI